MSNDTAVGVTIVGILTVAVGIGSLAAIAAVHLVLQHGLVNFLYGAMVVGLALIAIGLGLAE